MTGTLLTDWLSFISFLFLYFFSASYRLQESASSGVRKNKCAFVSLTFQGQITFVVAYCVWRKVDRRCEDFLFCWISDSVTVRILWIGGQSSLPLKFCRGHHRLHRHTFFKYWNLLWGNYFFSLHQLVRLKRLVWETQLQLTCWV